MLEQSEILTLDDNKEYVVTFTVMLNNKNYVFLVEQDNYENNMFCEYNDSGLTEVLDIDVIEELLKLYAEYVHE